VVSGVAASITRALRPSQLAAVAQMGYESYATELSVRSRTELPQWNELSPDTRIAWMRAARVMIDGGYWAYRYSTTEGRHRAGDDSDSVQAGPDDTAVHE
jgi:hypothetical protein